MNEPEVSKDLVFEEPRVPNEYARGDDKTQPRGHWELHEIEDVLWRVRASGGTDSTPIKMGSAARRDNGYRGGTEIRALHVEASPVYEVPRRDRQHTCRACEDTGVIDGAEPCPVCQGPAPLDPRLIVLAHVIAGAFVLPVVLWAVLSVWSWLLF